MPKSWFSTDWQKLGVGQLLMNYGKMNALAHCDGSIYWYNHCREQSGLTY